MAGYQPERGRGRERPDRYRGRGRDSYDGDDQSWSSGSQRAGTRGGQPRGRYRDAGYQARPGYRDRGDDASGYRPGAGRPGRDARPHSRGADPYGRDVDPYGRGADPYGRDVDPYGRDVDPYGRGADPYGRGADPYGRGAGRPYGNGHRQAARSRQETRPRRRDTTGGAEGNERLTAMTGATLLLLLAAEGLTIPGIRNQLTLHFFVGMLLVGPVLLKASSTVYRFARYYTGTPEYRRKGPPAPLLRLLGPFVLTLSLTVIGTGVMLAVVGPGPQAQLWLFLHKASFVLWFCAMSVHVLAYVWRLPHLISSDLATRAGPRAREVLAGRPARWLLLTAAILVGLLLAVATVHLAGPWTKAFTGL